jgi:hypothetical protein
MKQLKIALRAATLSFGIALSGACAPVTTEAAPAAKAAPSDLDRIGYAVGPCRGTCPVYSFSIAADGISYFVGERHTATSGRMAARGDPMLFNRLKALLQPLRPAAGDRTIQQEDCEPYYTDQQVVTVTWGWGSNQENSLSLDLGCADPRHAAVRDTLSGVRRLLPIDDYVGRATLF